MDRINSVRLTPFLNPPTDLLELISNPEIQIFTFMKQLNYIPYIVPMMGPYLYNGVYYMATIKETNTLNKMIISPGIGKLKDMIFVSKQIAHTMQYLSEKGLAHLGLMTSNIYVYSSDSADSQYSIKIGGFKNSVIFSDDEMNRNDLSRPAFICSNSPPDFILNKTNKFRTSDYFNADIWAFGCILYEMATVGKHPFQKYLNSNEDVSILENFLQDKSVSDLFSRNLDFPVQSLIERCLVSQYLKSNSNPPKWKDIINELESLNPSDPSSVQMEDKSQNPSSKYSEQYTE